MHAMPHGTQRHTALVRTLRVTRAPHSAQSNVRFAQAIARSALSRETQRYPLPGGGGTFSRRSDQVEQCRQSELSDHAVPVTVRLDAVGHIMGALEMAHGGIREWTERPIHGQARAMLVE